MNDSFAMPLTIWAAVRQALGLPQRAWALYLGVSTGQVSHLESGRRPGAAQWPRLARLLPLLPPPGGSGPAAPSQIELPPLTADWPAAPAAISAATRPALRRAHRQAARTAANLRADLLARHARAAIVARQRAAIGLLETPDPTDRAPARSRRLVEALRLEVEIHTGPGSALDPARLAYDTLRLWLLETEAATLAAWLENG